MGGDKGYIISSLRVPFGWWIVWRFLVLSLLQLFYYIVSGFFFSYFFTSFLSTGMEFRLDSSWLNAMGTGACIHLGNQKEL